MRVFRATDSAGTSVVVTVDDSGVLHGSTEPEIGTLFGLRLGYRGILRRYFRPREFDVVELTGHEADAARKAAVPVRDDLNHDIRQVLSAAIVAGRAGVSQEIAAAAIDAYLYATTIVAVSGAPVVGVATNVIGPDGCAYTEYLREHIDDLLEAPAPSDDNFDLFEFLKPRVPASVTLPRLRPIFESSSQGWLWNSRRLTYRTRTLSSWSPRSEPGPTLWTRTSIAESSIWPSCGAAGTGWSTSSRSG